MRLIERTVVGDSRIDEKNRTLDDVAVLTPTSKNKRSYSESARRDLVKLINKRGIVHVYNDHGVQPGRSRKVADLVGGLSHARLDGDGTVRAKLHVLSERTWPVVRNVARGAARLLGLSIDAQGETTTKGGQGLVKSISALASVDLVTAPASTSSLFESRDGNMLDEDEIKQRLRDAMAADRGKFVKPSSIRSDPETKRKLRTAMRNGRVGRW